MNKIRIATNDMALTVKMSDEQANVWFGTLTRALLGEYSDIAEPVEVEEPEAEDSEPETEEQPSDLDEDEPEPVEEPTLQESYQGLSAYHLCTLRRNRQLQRAVPDRVLSL